MMYLNKFVIAISTIIIILVGIFFGITIYKQQFEVGKKNNIIEDTNVLRIENNIEISTVETAAEEEKTTPNTLIIYKTYYTKCKHFVQRYEDIDATLVNLTEKELREKCREWNVEKFSSKEIELSKEEENFCNEHYKLKLENNAIVVYNVDENGVETEYEHTGITTEYLTEEDILRLTTGIIIYGQENLTSTIEDYE